MARAFFGEKTWQEVAQSFEIQRIFILEGNYLTLGENGAMVLAYAAILGSLLAPAAWHRFRTCSAGMADQSLVFGRKNLASRFRSSDSRLGARARQRTFGYVFLYCFIFGGRYPGLGITGRGVSDCRRNLLRHRVQLGNHGRVVARRDSAGPSCRWITAAIGHSGNGAGRLYFRRPLLAAVGHDHHGLDRRQLRPHRPRTYPVSLFSHHCHPWLWE